MEKDTRKSVETQENTNPFPIHPDLDVPPICAGTGKDGKVGECELVQEVEMINPDPNSLDRG